MQILNNYRISALSLFLSAAPIIASIYPATSVRIKNEYLQPKTYVIGENKIIEEIPQTKDIPIFRSLKNDRNVTTMKVVNLQSAVTMEVAATNSVLQDNQLEREFYCAHNATLVNHTCIKSTLQKAHITCPAGLKKSANGCIGYLSGTQTCPQDYVLKGHSCVATVAAEPTYMCMGTGEIYNPDSGLCERSTLGSTTCPDGYTLRDGNCVITSPVYPQCPDTYTLSATSQNCVRTLNLVGQPTCPEACTYNANVGNCECLYQGAPSCPNLYTYNPTSNNCVALAGKVPTACPDGYVFTDDGYCQQILTTSAITSCPTGYELVDGVCTTNILGANDCPAGYEIEDGMCEQIEALEATCATGMELVNITDTLTGVITPQCSNITYTNLMLCCDTGYELINNTICQKPIVSEALWSCDGECYSVETSEATYACPNGTVFSYSINNITNLQEPICTRNISLEVCVTSLDTTNCTTVAPADVTDTTAFLPIRKLQDNGTIDVIINITDPCVTTPQCENVTRLEIYAAQASCPDGGDIINGLCVTTVSVESEPICTSGEYDDETGTCIEYVLGDPMQKCPNGGTPNGINCTNIEYVTPDYVCPSYAFNNSLGQCVTQYQALLGATQTYSVTPTYTCTSPQVLGADGISCNQVILESILYTCPDGSNEVANEYCLITADLIIPSPVLTTYTPQYTCPDGSIANGENGCTLVQSIAPTYACPTNMVYDEATVSCASISSPLIQSPTLTQNQPVAVCPSGSRFTDNLCYSTTTMTPTITCDEGELVNNRCVITSALAYTCPKATVLTADGCVKYTSTPPKVRVTKGCSTTVTSNGHTTNCA